jgi:hypothetical protein
VKNAFGDADETVNEYRNNLVRLREKFLDRAAVITEAAVLDAGE